MKNNQRKWGGLLDNNESNDSGMVLPKKAMTQNIFDDTGRSKGNTFFYLFLPIIATFSVFNLMENNWVVGCIEAVLLLTGLTVLALRDRMSIATFSHLSVAHITFLTFAFIFFPAVGDSAYLWAIGLPYFTSYLVGSKAAMKWDILFFVACVSVGLILFLQGEQLYWGWEKAPYIALPYIVMSIFSILFARYLECYIVELKDAEAQISKHAKALEESESRYRTLLQSSMNAVGVHKDGKWVYANPECLKLLGAESFEDIADIPIMEFVHSDYRHMVSERLREMSGTKKTIAMVEEKFLRLDGTSFPAEVSATPIVYDGQEAFMLTVKDVTERKKYERTQKSLRLQLEHSQRLESLGVLAGGIAHDFNNLLAAIAGNAELLRAEIGDVSAAKTYMTHIDESCDHAADLCQQLLAYAGKGKYVLDTIDMNELVKSMSRLIRASVHSNIDLKVKLDKKLPLIEGDVSQIKQIILNFIVNSADAIGDKEGQIKISTFTTLVDREMMLSLYNGVNLFEGKYLVLEVRDTGCGIDKALQKQIFDPFFTTKKTGSGLGLSAVFGIISAHKGAVHLYSEPGEGAVFRIFLPLSAHTKAVHIVDTGEVKAWVGEGLVLIVDDDKTVRDVVRAFVEKAGFDVITADDGREGVDVFQQHHKKIKAVLLDMTMPRLGGVDAMREMRVIDSSVPIVMVSGYSEIETGNLDSSAQPDGFVQKPFRYKDVIKVLYKVTSG